MAASRREHIEGARSPSQPAEKSACRAADDHVLQLQAPLTIRVSFVGRLYPAQSDDGDDEQNHQGEQQGAGTGTAAQVLVVDEHPDQDADGKFPDRTAVRGAWPRS